MTQNGVAPGSAVAPGGEQVRARFAGQGFGLEELAYLDQHASRISFTLGLAARLLSQWPQPRVLDVGPSFLTACLRDLLPPGGELNSLGWHWDRFQDAVNRHFQFDLNQAQEPGEWIPGSPHQLIILAEVIEHLFTAPSLVLSFLNTFLAPGGMLLIQTPNAASLDKRLALLRGRNPYEPIRELRQHPGHFREYTGAELAAYCQAAGLAVEEIILADFYPVRPRYALLHRWFPSLRQGITLLARRKKENRG